MLVHMIDQESGERMTDAQLTSEQVAQRHKLAWVPFGTGQRQCIGKDFSIMEAQIILAMIVQRYTLTAVPGPAALPKLTSTLKPNRPVFVCMEQRAG